MKNNKIIKILLADDHEAMRQSIKSLLDSAENFSVIDTAADGSEMIRKYFIHKPDIVVTDISMPVISGLDALKEILKKDNSAKVLFLSVHEVEEYINYCQTAGGKGIISKLAGTEELIKAIEEINSGKTYFKLPENVEAIKKHDPDFKEDITTIGLEELNLNVDEERFIQLTGKGITSDEAAKILEIKPEELNDLKTSIMKKLKLKSLPDLIKFAAEYAFRKNKYE
ncbi:MAG: response regulator [Ignavibacteriaceae bacterium]|nr:response regulator [Ignavibacteriaceae bacterium]